MHVYDLGFKRLRQENLKFKPSLGNLVAYCINILKRKKKKIEANGIAQHFLQAPVPHTRNFFKWEPSCYLHINGKTSRKTGTPIQLIVQLGM